MWRRRVSLALGVAVIAIITLAGPGSAVAAASGPSATGGSHLTVHDVFGLHTLQLQEFGFNAEVQGGVVGGWFTYRDVEDGAPFTADGLVTCLTVIGSDAWIGATIDRSNDSSLDSFGAWWHVTDNGEGRGSTPDVTTFLGVGSLSDTTAFCADHPPYRFPFSIDGGDIQVRG